MFVRCLHCHEPIELLHDSDLRRVYCSSCGGSFSLVGDDTLSWSGQTTKKLGPFELIEQVGGGAFGTVWKARDPVLERTVAIKVPRKGQLDEKETEQFLREARHAARLRHPNIVAVHEVGRDGDTVYIVSDFVQGATLDEWLTGRSLSPREAAMLCVEIAEALHHAHEAEVIHRDLKPGNVMLDLEGHPHLMDFGLSRREVGEVTMTVDGQVMGTPAYMSPEQAGGKAHMADRRSDIYSLGVILFRLLTGELPYRGSAQMVIVQKQREDAPSVRKLNVRIPRDIETICLKCLEREPRKRYVTAQALAQDLRRWLSGEPIQARVITRMARAWRWCKRNPVVSALAAGLIVVFSGGFGGVTWQWIRANDAAATAEAEADLKRRQLYVAEMNVAGQAWEENNFSRVEEILRLWEPQPGTVDLRGFEWYYLWRLCDRGRTAETIDHTGRARKIAVSLNRNRLAVGYGNGAVSVWDIRSRTSQGRFREPSGIVPALSAVSPIKGLPLAEWERPYVAFSDDGDWLACPSQDYREVIVYSIPKQIELRRASAEDNQYLCAAAFSPDGRCLATGSSDGVVLLWDHLGNSYPLVGHKDIVLSVDFSPSGKYLASSSADRSVIVWDVTTMKKASVLKGHSAEVWSVSFADDERYLASGSIDTTVRLWDRLTGTATVLAGHSDEVRSVAFSPDGRLLASGSRDNIAIIWDRATGREVERLKGHSHNVESVAFWSDSGSLKLLTGSSDRTVKCWDIGVRRPDVLLPTTSGVSPELDGDSATPKRQNLSNLAASMVAISPDGRLAATIRAGTSGQARVQDVSLFDLETGVARSILFHGNGDAQSLAMSGQYVAIGTKGGIRMRRFAASGEVGEEELLEAKTSAPMTSVGFSQDGTLLAAGTSDGVVVVWNVHSKERLFEQSGGSRRMVTAIGFAPCGDVLAVGTADGRVRLWESTTGRTVNDIAASSERVYCVAFSRDGEILASGGSDGTPRLWRNWRDASCWGDELVGHSDVISAIMFPPDGRTVITSSHDCTLRVWDLRELRVRLSLKERSSIDSADFAAAALCMVSWSRDGTVRVWRAARKDEVDRTTW